MSTLENQTLYETGSVAPPDMSVDAPTGSQTPNTTPSGHINSSNFLSQMTHTGYTVRMNLPVVADEGPTPIFAFKVDPIALIPNVTSHEGEDGKVNVYDKLSDAIKGNLSCVTFNGSICHLDGVESPQSRFARAVRFRRFNMVYSLRFSYQFAGTGLFAVVPVKGLPFNQIPLRDQVFGGPLVSAAMFNSYALADGSRTREIKFTCPWEYPFKYRDLYMDIALAGDNSASDTFPTYPQNWFVVFARGSFVAPDNLSFIDIMVDHAMTDFELLTPLLCHEGMFLTRSPIVTEGKKVTYLAWVNYTSSGSAVKNQKNWLKPASDKKVKKKDLLEGDEKVCSLAQA